MSGWDKPSHSDRPDDGSDGRGERRRESWERPFPGAPRDRPPAPEIDKSKLRSFEEIAAERRGPEAYREYLDRMAAQRERLDEKPTSDGSPGRGRESSPEAFPLQVSRDRLREIYATCKTSAELDAAMAAEKARLAQGQPASSETAERTGTRPRCRWDKSSEKELEAELAETK